MMRRASSHWPNNYVFKTLLFFKGKSQQRLTFQVQVLLHFDIAQHISIQIPWGPPPSFWCVESATELIDVV